jgi:hypothetical protein
LGCGATSMGLVTYIDLGFASQTRSSSNFLGGSHLQVLEAFASYLCLVLEGLDSSCLSPVLGEVDSSCLCPVLEELDSSCLSPELEELDSSCLCPVLEELDSSSLFPVLEELSSSDPRSIASVHYPNTIKDPTPAIDGPSVALDTHL